MTVPAAEMTGVTRRFGSTLALSEACLSLAAGEVHALVGENGAGKTTLMRILAGLDRPDSGAVLLHGSPVTRFAARALRDRGVAMVQQHFTLVPTLTAGENLALARPEGRLRPNASRLRARISQLAESYGLELRVDRPVGQLSVGERQRLEILRALDFDARLLILDEPTAVLTDAEARRLLAVCRRLAGEGRTVVIITHRLGEVLAGCDRVTVLRSGSVVLSGAAVASHTESSLATLMVGSGEPPLRSATRGAFDALNASNGPRVARLARVRVTGFELEVGAGEIVGIAGVDGNGQAELEAALAGLRPGSQVTIDGVPVPTGDPRARIAAGVAYIPSDRNQRALAGTLSIADNLELGRTPRWRATSRRRHRAAGPALRDWSIRTAGPAAPAATLSGGNAQKLVLARELTTPPRVIIAAYPTRGLDPEAARTITTRILAAAAQGAGVIWFAAELDELFTVADRILVLAAGTPPRPFHPPYDRPAIGLAMTGAQPR